MGTVQFMCARLGMVTGDGLGAAFRNRFPHWLVVLFSLALLAANAINIGADLSGMADAANLLTGLPSLPMVCVFGAGIAIATVAFSVPAHREHLEVARAQPAGLCGHGVCRRRGLERGACTTALSPRCRTGKGGVGDAGRDSGHDDQPLSVLLAGSRRRKSEDRKKGKHTRQPAQRDRGRDLEAGNLMWHWGRFFRTS